MKSNKQSGFTLIELLIVMSIVLILGTVAFSLLSHKSSGGFFSRTDSADAIRILNNQGYKDVQITGYRWYGCSNEWFHTGFVAVGPNGNHVSGVVCKGSNALGMGKLSTIRFE